MQHSDSIEQDVDNTSTFSNNMSLPVHRWFRYSAGFSAQWVETVIKEFADGSTTLHVFDPFAGSGTVLLASERANAKGMGLETHPFVASIAQAKLLWRTNVEDFTRIATSFVDQAQQLPGNAEGYPPLIYKCYPDTVLRQLDSLKKALNVFPDKDRPEYRLLWMALVAILRVSSPVGTAQWQYVLPKRSKVKTVDPFAAFAMQVQMMIADMKTLQASVDGPEAVLYQEDARHSTSVPDGWADLVITSPPYANNYDYADATRLEMSFLGEVASWGDLQDKVRKYLVRSSTQHVAKHVSDTWAIVENESLAAIHPDIKVVCEQLSHERDRHGGKKPYHTMVAYYFYDLAQAWRNLRRITKPGGTVCFVIGDSAPYGVYVPVDRWLGELAISAGFKEYSFEKIRERNIKWRNRKHTVPLHEGRLWVQG